MARAAGAAGAGTGGGAGGGGGMSLADRVQVDGKFKPNVTNAAPRTNVRITRLAVSKPKGFATWW